jgi:hypothetical protein
MRTHTMHTVRELLQAEWESDLPDKVIEALRPQDGKNVTTRLLDKLPGGKEVWHLRREYGMTHIVNEAYRRGDYRNGVSLLLYHSEASLSLDLKHVQEKNPAYFSARLERNHARMEAMNTRETLEAIAAAMNAAEVAIAQLLEANARVEALTEYGTTLHPDRYDILKACGLSDTESRPLLNRDYTTRTPEPTEEV